MKLVDQLPSRAFDARQLHPGSGKILSSPLPNTPELLQPPGELITGEGEFLLPLPDGLLLGRRVGLLG